MIKKILSKHEKILDFLINLHQKDKSFLFMPRERNTKNRLSEGYWFRGNDRYLQVSFWKGSDWKEKIHNIGFSVNADGHSYIEITAQASAKKAKFLSLLVEKMGGFNKSKSKYWWSRDYPGTDYLSNLEEFLRKDKPIIDAMIKEYKPEGISFLDENLDKRYIDKIIILRNKQMDSGENSKVARICWNTEGWKFPSGPLGKSSDPNSYEAKYGYGHEEWLFDKSKIIDGFHYAFLQPLSTKFGKHGGKSYNVSLFTINGEGRKFYVGDIKNAFCISKEEAEKVYQTYKNNGWLNEMVEDIRRVKGELDVFLKSQPISVFNVKFRFEDVRQLDELEEISKDDINITTNRLKLLPKKTDFVISEVIADDEPEGKQRSELPRKVVLKKEVEYDPYHNKMQNALRKILQESYKDEYEKVCIETSRVDIKARTKTGKWHFFEIKTDTPKICIRNALGQIMEYAYWPDSERAEKLIIVGEDLPNNEAKLYLGYVRNRFKVPVYYRSLDINKKSLSKDY